MQEEIINRIIDTCYNSILKSSAPNAIWNIAYVPLIRDLRGYVCISRIKDKVIIRDSYERMFK